MGMPIRYVLARDMLDPDVRSGGLALSRGTPLTFLKPNLQSLSQQVYHWLRERIVTGSLAAGERISVDQIAVEIGVSRTPVRDAINRLALEGLVVVQPRRGTVIGSVTLQDIRDIYQFRGFLEPSICEYAAEHNNQALIRDLEQIQADWEAINLAQIYHDYATTMRYTELNAAFHLRLTDETGNARLRQTIAQLYLQPRLAPVIYGSNYQGPARRMAEHRVIIEAIRSGDGGGAFKSMREHLSNAGDNLIAHFSASSPLPVDGNSPISDAQYDTRSGGDSLAAQ